MTACDHLVVGRFRTLVGEVMLVSFDDRANLAYSLVVSPPVPANSGEAFEVKPGTTWATPPFNALAWPLGLLPTAQNSEIVRVTAVSEDIFTVIRAQEGTSAKHILVGWQIADVATDATFTAIESAILAEVTRAEGAEAALTTAIGTKATTTSLNSEIARAEGVEATLAPLNSPALTGSPTAPTKTALDASTKLATTAYADSAVGVEAARATAAETAITGGSLDSRYEVGGTALGNMGASKSVAFSATHQVRATGTLNSASCTLTVTGLVAFAQIEVRVVQDATGGRALTLSDGTNTLALTPNTAANAATTFIVTVAANGTDLTVDGA